MNNLINQDTIIGLDFNKSLLQLDKLNHNYEITSLTRKKRIELTLSP